MSYDESRDMIWKNLSLLNQIAIAVERGENLELKYTPDTYPKMQRHINRVLASARVFKDVEGGRFAHLKKATRTKGNPDTTSVTIIIKDRAPSNIISKDIEAALINCMRDHDTTDIKPVEVYETESFQFNDPDHRAHWEGEFNKIGWTLRFDIAQRKQDGVIIMPVARITPLAPEERGKSAFAMLKEAGYGQGDLSPEG